MHPAGVHGPAHTPRWRVLHAAGLRQGRRSRFYAQMPGALGPGGGSMTLKRDHVAGGVFVVAGVLVLAVSGDLPFGTPSSPGAGMLPTLVVGLMMAFGFILLLQ